jgi:hypothetical protein
MAAAPLDEWTEPLASGSSLIVGLVRADGRPFVTRGWGLSMPTGDDTATVLLGATEVAALGYPDGGARGSTIAVTVTEIRSLHALQVKGPIVSIALPTDEHLQRMADYCRQFVDAVAQIDKGSPVLLGRIVPDDVVACSFTVRERYDQTPGPGAGRPVGPGA